MLAERMVAYLAGCSAGNSADLLVDNSVASKAARMAEWRAGATADWMVEHWGDWMAAY